MTNDKFIPQAPKTYEVKYIGEEIQLPKLSEITDENGKVKLPPELVEKMQDMQISCMATGCGNTYVSRWMHSNCSCTYPGNIQWSTHARLKCPSCDLVTLTDVVSMLLEYPGANRQFAAKFLK
ncbi:29429_t:CDS:2, partial [Racocetra persica]